MPKLFIEPPHGSLGKTMEALREEGFKPQLVGYGYPPMYVEEDNTDRLNRAKEIAKETDSGVKTQPYRADLIDNAKLLEILGSFLDDDMNALVVILKDVPAGRVAGTTYNKATQLIQIMENQNKLPALIEAAYKIAPHRFNL